MSNDIAHQIAELEASLTQPLPEAVRRLAVQQIAELRRRPAAVIDLRGAYRSSEKESGRG